MVLRNHNGNEELNLFLLSVSFLVLLQTYYGKKSWSKHLKKMHKATSKENELKQNVDTTIKIMKELADPSADVSISDLLDLVSQNLSQR